MPVKRKHAPQLEIEGRRISVSNLEKVLYPASHFTKGQVIDYYIRIADYLLPHVRQRTVTLKRFPDGVMGEFFYEKDAPKFTPPWVTTFPVPRKDDSGGSINYIVIEDLPTLAWLANLANLEIHPFLHKIPNLDRPTHVVFDLDPGPGADILQCGRVAFFIRDLLAGLRLEAFVKVSGSKGLQVYIPLNVETARYAVTQAFAKAVAEFVEKHHPALAIAKMSKALRKGKVFIDWSQNADFKSTVGVYSLRAKSMKPFVSMPVDWDELAAAIKANDTERLYFKPDAAIRRVSEKGDLFAPVLSMRQALPAEFDFAKPAAPRKQVVKQSSMPATARSSRQGSRRRFVAQKTKVHLDLGEGLPPLKNVKVWDSGTYAVIEGSISKGRLLVYFDGKKLKGETRLVRSDKDDSWRLSESEKPASEPDLSSLPDSRLRFVEPMLARLVTQAPKGAAWSYELKLDGYRVLAIKEAHGLTLYSRRGNSLNAKFPEIAAALRTLEDGTMIDGEIVALDDQGRPSFSALQNYQTSKAPFYFYAFDLVAYRGKDLRGLPLADRREILERFTLADAEDPVRVSKTFEADPADLIRVLKQQGLEGFIAKKRDSAYEAGERSGAWIKYKTNRGQEMVIGGYRPGSHGFEYLLVGYYEGQRLIFAGKINNGFVPALRRRLTQHFKTFETDICPFANLPEPKNARRGEALTADVMKKCVWLRPKLVAQIEYTEWTAGNHLRHSRFAGLRDDKDPREVTREKAA